MPWFFVGLASGLPDEPGKGKRPGKDARRCSREFLRALMLDAAVQIERDQFADR